MENGGIKCQKLIQSINKGSADLFEVSNVVLRAGSRRFRRILLRTEKDKSDQ